MLRPWLLAAATCVLSVAPVWADGFIIIEEPPPELRPRPGITRHFPLEVERHLVNVTVDDQVATTEVDQTFRNPTDARLEGTYMFPLPEDAAVTEFELWIDGEPVMGEVLASDQAREIYEGIVRRIEDPALLEYMGRGMFKVRIFPIEPRSSRRIRITYRQVLQAENGRCRYRYPLNTEKFSAAPLERAAISVSVRSEQAIKGVYSPWHDVDLERAGDHEVLASWEDSNVTPNRDFVLDYDLDDNDVGMGLRTFAQVGEQGSFLLTIAPKTELEAAQRQAKDVVFVLDCSGSMAQDGKMEQAQQALRYCVGQLDPEDRFAIVAYATTARTFRDDLVPASEEYKEAALGYTQNLRARGGTAIDEALRRALAYGDAEQDARPFQVVFLTDGQPTIGETEPDRILERARTAAEGLDARLFVWGVGHDLNAHLLDRLAMSHRGSSNYVLPGENLEVAMSNFYDKIASPVLTDLQLTFENIRVEDVYPRELPDLFAGGQLIVVGRFEGEGHGAIRLGGKLQGEQVEFVYEGAFAREETNPHVPRLWARKKIAFLLDQIRLNGESQELKQEVVALAQRYGLPTPYTSYLVVEDESQLARPAAPAETAAREAFGRLRGADDGAGGFEPAPMANDAEGEDAVRAARQSGELRDSDRADFGGISGLDQETVEEAIREVNGRTFYRSGERWVDATVPSRDEAETWLEVEYMSDAYFALLSEHPELGVYFALGRVMVVHRGVVYDVQ